MLGVLVALVLPAVAQEGARIDRVDIKGEQRVEQEAIRVQIRSQPGTRLSEATVDSDVRALYKMGFFDNIEADFSEQGGLGVLTFTVKERPLIKQIRVEGNKKLDRDELEAVFKVRPNTILDPEKVRSGIDEAKKLYEKKGYLDATITYKTTPAPDDEVVLVYDIDEGTVVRISALNLEGAQAFTPSQLKRVMQTQEEWFLSFLTNRGNLDNEVLKADTERLTAFYYDNGYIDVKISDPVVERQEKGLEVTIKIDEGEQYKVGSVTITGDTLPDQARALGALSLESGDVFRTSKLREDINSLTEVYGDEGYAFVNITPETSVNPTDKTVDVAYKASKGPQVYIDKIEITGNSKTRDKVIRREILLGEQELFSGSRLRRSQERLKRLGFFEDVNITTRRSESEDRLDLLVDVKEASTGSFSAGAGISSGETFLFNVRLTEINFLGRGQRLTLNADFGSIRRNLSIDFTEPYFMDTLVTARVSGFNWRLIFSDFTRGGTGGSVSLLYPLAALGWGTFLGLPLEDWRGGLEYRLEQASISDVATNAPSVIRASQGTSLTSAIVPRLFRDTRNHPFDPTSGSLMDFAFEVAGIGGQSKFIKPEARVRWYYPFYRNPSIGTFVLSLGGTLGLGYGYGGVRELPLFERYFPGGINSVRGFRILSLGPQNVVQNSYGQFISRDPIGGSEQLIFNNEIIFPIVESLGLKGVVFFDAGNAFTVSQGIDFNQMRLAVGGGIRWLSPVGPLRIELGFPINKQVGDDTQTVMFSFGGPP